MPKSKDRKGALEGAKKILKDKLSKIPFSQRVEAFKRLEEWAYNELGEEEREIFLEALYDEDVSYDIQISIAVDKAVDDIVKEGKL